MCFGLSVTKTDPPATATPTGKLKLTGTSRCVSAARSTSSSFPSALLTTSQLTKPGRAHYFASIASGFQGDVFLDPDNGIAPSKPEPAHVAAAEVFALLTPENVVAVYQHRPQRVSAPWLARYVQLVIATGARVVGYESAQVGMLFVTKSASRESAVRQALANRLGAVAVARGSFAGRLI